MKGLFLSAVPVIMPATRQKKLPDYNMNYETQRMFLKYKKSNQYPGKMTKAFYTVTSEYVEEINALPVKRQVSVSGILKN